MRWIHSFAALGAAFAAVAPAAGKPAVEANLAHADGRSGAELGLGYTFGIAVFNIRPMAGALVYRGSGDRYQEVAGSCRDTGNGSAVHGWRCENLGAKPYGRVEATYAIPFVAELGVGGRYSGDKVRAYGTAAFSFLPKIKLKANGGPHYAAAGVTLGF